MAQILGGAIAAAGAGFLAGYTGAIVVGGGPPDHDRVVPDMDVGAMVDTDDTDDDDDAAGDDDDDDGDDDILIVSVRILTQASPRRLDL